MSKIITYTLDSDGTVPPFVLDGGYFPAASGGQSPQDWLLMGIAEDTAPGDGFSDADAIEAYLVSIGAGSWTDLEGVPLDLPAQAASMWARMSES